MRLRLAITTLFLGIFTFGFAQDSNILIKGNKKYPATPVWNFLCDNYKFDQDLEVQIAKTETGALLKLTIDVSDKNKLIGGRVYLVLQNGDFIYCADKGMRESIEGKSIAYYSLSVQEMAKLKSKRIDNIRFRIIGKDSDFGSDIGYFTASNKKHMIDPFDNSSNKWDTTNDLKRLSSH